MPVYIFEESAFEKILEVEGERHRRFMTEKEYGVCSFEAFLRKWCRDFKYHPSLKNYNPRFAIDVEGNRAIYGLEGYNRYVVFNNGEIALLKASSNRIYIEKARKAGFRMSYEV